MKLKRFYIGLSADDFLIKNPEGAEFPYRTSNIVSDFNFLTDYFSNYIERGLNSLKYKTNNFDTLMIRGRKKRKGVVLKEHLKTLEIEIPFKEEKYHSIYPHINEYPINELLIPVENNNQLSNFLLAMVLDAMEIARAEKVNIPIEFIINRVLDFKKKNFENTWVYRQKRVPKTDLVSKLICNLSSDSFKLYLVVVDKKGKERFRKVILVTLPSAIQYKGEFRDIVFKDKFICVTKEGGENLYEIDIYSIENINC